MCVLILFSFVLLITGTDVASKPNILFIIVDDLGWNDVEYHGTSFAKTPNLNKLQDNSYIFTNYYVNKVCSPTRSAFLSGRYPEVTGMQHGTIKPDQAYGLNLKAPTIADQLKVAGYHTHCIGKWHAGFVTVDYTPLDRGFDTFYGFYVGAEDYYNHTRKYKTKGAFYDLRYNDDPMKADDQHSTELFTTRALQLFDQEAQDGSANPWYMYLAYQAVHGPLESPPGTEDLFPEVEEEDRRIKMQMLWDLDIKLGMLHNRLEENGQLDNTIIIITTDNGGPISEGADNFPLRGSKATLWEGGLKGVGMLHLNGVTSHKPIDGLLTAVDWYPTIMKLAGLDLINGGFGEGLDMVDMIFNHSVSPRTEILHYVDAYQCQPALKFKKKHHLESDPNLMNLCGAIRVGDYKLIMGNLGTGKIDVWGNNEINGNPTIECSGTPPNNPTGDNYCINNGKPCMFNIKDDPCEYNDLYEAHPEKGQELLDRLLYWNTTQTLALYGKYTQGDKDANPEKHGGWWSPWKSTKKLHPGLKKCKAKYSKTCLCTYCTADGSLSMANPLSALSEHIHASPYVVTGIMVGVCIFICSLFLSLRRRTKRKQARRSRYTRQQPTHQIHQTQSLPTAQPARVSTDHSYPGYTINHSGDLNERLILTDIDEV